MGTGHEQPEAESTGDSHERSDLSEISEELPPFTDEDKILYMLQNPNDDLAHRKEFLVQRWSELRNTDEKGRYISTVYGGLLKQFNVDGVEVGYHYEPEGLYLYEGTYKSRTKESLFSWNLVAELIDQLIKEGKYYQPEKKEPESAQIGFFDFIDNAVPAEQTAMEPEQVSLFADFGISQQIIDEALCIGANDTNSTLDIAMFFRRDRGTEYNAKFLKSHYGTNGAGFFFDGEQISVWYDENGINIAKGNTAQKSSATHLNWEQAAQRIRELLDLGRYMPQYQLDKIDDYELSYVAERIVFFLRDMDKDSKERCFPSLYEALNGVYGYPDQVEIVKGALSNPDTFNDLDNDYIEFIDDLNRGNIHGLYRFAFNYSPEYVYEIMQGMSLEKVDFKAQSGFNPDRQYFITNDEINKLLRRGSSYAESRYRIYTFFVNHSDMQERIKMIKEEYGTGGYAAGNDNANYDGKGLFFSHGSSLEPYAKVLLKWNEVVKRIDVLVKADKFLSDEDIAKLPEIEKDMIARTVVAFFELASREYAKPFSEDIEPYNRESVVKAQLDNPQALDDIDRMMSDALALMDKSNGRDYEWYQKQYDNFVAFKNGEYHPYAVPEKKAPLPRPTKFSQPAEKESEQNKELNAVDDLFAACKIDDMTVDFKNGEIVARDGDSEWRGAELYYFILNEVLSFDIYGNLMEGYSVDEGIINSVKEYAKKYDVVPQAVENSASIRRQLELKEANSDSIILYKQHEAFEVIGEDARTVAFELQTRLGETTYPNKTQQFVPETWFEAERLECAANKLIENGHQVIIADDETALPAQEYFAHINEPPIWKTYKQLDEQYPDTLLFMRLGDFYEVMGENAKIVSKELDLVLTGRTINTQTGERTPMCGVPAHNIDLYISQLVAKGYKVAIAENQDVNRVVAPGKVQQLTPLERAKQLINEYRREEFGYEESADFSDLSNVNLATTETEDGKHTIDVNVDLIHFEVVQFLDGNRVEVTTYDSLEELINEVLENISFDDLVFTKDLEKIVESLNKTFSDADYGRYTVHYGYESSGEGTKWAIVDNETHDFYIDSDNLDHAFDTKTEAVEYLESLELDKEVTLAERLVAFAKDTDFYDYADNLEIGETDEDAVAKMAEHIKDKSNCEGIISYLSDYAAEKSIDQHEAQQTYDTPNFSRVDEMQSLIHDLTEHTATLEDKVEPDHSEMIGDEIVIDGSHFIIEEVKGDYVSMRDVTFAENAGFPIFRRERIEDIFPLLPEKEEPVVEILPAPPQQPKTKVRTFDLHPEIPLEARHNYNFAEKDIESVGKKERFRRNMEAINVLKECEFEGRFATPEEQEILSQYVGWGGIPEAFDPNNSAWADEYKELIVALSPEEYDAAMESTLTAFYTPQTVISAIYKALENLGFKQGNILEPSCGIGNFIGMLPDSMKDSKMYGIELDSISAQIAQQLYQKSSVLASPFEEAILPDSFFDAVVGNVPFGDFKVADKRYDKNNFLIHDYFFAKSLDKLRTGGVMLLVTSMGTMDKESSNVRRYIAQRADLLGAIRLPNDTFKGNAGTDVTSDILIFQKRDRIVNEEPDWLMLDTTEDGIRMNKYFVDHPEMIMGEMVMKSGRFGPEPTCEPFEDRTLEEQLDIAIRNIKGEITEYEIDEEEIEDDRQYLPADPTVRNFSYTVVDGTIFYRENSMMKEVKVSATAENRIKGLINIRQSVRRLIELQTEDYPEEEILSEQQNLNELYDGFTAKYGLINSRANKSAFADDGSYYLLTALEVLDDEGNLERKADMFTKRTIKPHIPVTSVDTSIEAVAVSMGEKAEIDLEYMMQLTGKTEEEIADDLTGIIFLNPMYSEDRPAEKKYLMADEYLSGDVRAKLRVAENMAKVNPAFEVNAEALRKVQPKDLTASEIDVRLGATWLPPKYIQQFIFELLDPPYYYSYKIKVNYSHYTGEWNITGKSSDKGNVKANSTYGTTRINAYKIIEQTLNLKDVRIFDYEIDDNGKRTPVLNKKETAIAQAKQELIKQAFKDWIWTDPDRRTELTRLYNDKFNSIRPREYDGSHITFSGMNPEISLRPHQKNAVAHILYGGNTLLAHAVGAGKTFEMVAAAQESKRLGLCTKSLFVVPNHLTEQWAAEYLTLYPSANILVATKKDFETKNRKTFCGKIATGDYDAVIIGHSQFEKIPVSVERQIYLIEEQINDIVKGIEEAKRNNAERFTVKQMQKTQKSLEARLKKLNDQTRKDDVVTFEELGVDRLFIDESHYYKNLFLYTKMRNVGGIAQTEAQKSSDLFMKCRYLDEITGGKGTVFATGTPISNSMVELYTIQRYLQYETLRRHDLQHFDAWASTFGETVTAVELTPEGTGYRAKTRFARFYNLPELMSMFKEVADIQTADMLNLPVPKANYHNIAVKPSEVQKEMVESLSERAEKVRSGQVKSWDDNMLVITNDGRKLALDQRMINPMLPDFEGSKVNACADNIFQIWQDNADKKSTQLVFCDLSTPKTDSFSVYTDIRDKLIAKGIPESEIAFIHDAKTEVQKAEMFKKVRKGEIRVLLGSTQKMGAGTNVQDRLIALHDLDCPWRPSDLEQRSGRIIRQGNSNEEVEIYRYVTEQTFDAYLYQLVEGKQKFASQIMSSKSPVRSAEDIDETALSYAEIKMLATGNPYIKEKMDLDIQVLKLRLLKSNYLSERYSLEDKVLKEFPQKIAEYDERIAGLEKDIVTAKKNPKSIGDTFVGMVVNGVPYSEKADAGQAIIDVCKTLPDTQIYPLGEYRGFKLSVHYEPFSHQHRVTIKGTISHEGILGTDAIGNITRIDNVIDGLEQMLTTTKALRDTTETQLANAKEQLEKPFAKDEELKQKEARLRELNALLNVDKRENEMVDEEPEQDESTPVRDDKDRDER
ncbi:MAG: DEAD/DEAH box helicase family protein [Eubacterium sp.]|nr:DEAD/DEAH box helicase family protein [Eubacterium sp.]